MLTFIFHGENNRELSIFLSIKIPVFKETPAAFGYRCMAFKVHLQGTLSEFGI